MNSYERQFKINRNLCHVRQSNRQKNVLRWGTNELDVHIDTKLEVAKSLKRMGCDFITEAILQNKSYRVDCLDLLNGVAYEIFASEKESSLDFKDTEYPFIVVRVKAGISKEEVMKITGEI
jgi:hypothetical protein